MAGSLPIMQPKEPIEDIEIERIGDFIKVERSKAGMSIRKLASTTKIDAAYIRDVEAGYLKKMPKEDIDRIADALGLSVQGRHQMYDLAADGCVPEDISEYIKENEFVRMFLRTAMDGYPATKTVCRKFMKNLIKMPNDTADALLRKFAAKKKQSSRPSDIFGSELQKSN